MFLMSLLPLVWFEYLVHLIFVTGVIGIVVGSFASKLPFISAYGTIVKAISSLLLVVGLFSEGYFYASKDIINETKKWEEKVKKSEELAKEANKNLSLALVSRNNEIKNSQVYIQDQITKFSAKIDSECKVPKEALNILNESSKRPGKK